MDLHVHTNASDGLYPPAEVVRLARDAGLAAVAVADHDTVAGLAEAFDAGEALGVEVVPGVELTAYAARAEVHVTGLFIDPGLEDPGRREVVSKIEEMREIRRTRMRRMVEKLAEQGVELDIDEVIAEASSSPGGSVGRPHLAKVLVRRGYAADTGEAFARYIGNQSPAYVRKKELTVAEAVAIVRDLGGLAIFAHPGVSNVDERIGEFVAAGMAGLEVWHTKHSRAQEKHYAGIARKHGLAPSGGSDFHGEGLGDARLGAPAVGYDVLEGLRERHAAATTRR